MSLGCKKSGVLCVYSTKGLKADLTIEEYNKGVDEWADDAYRFARSCSCDDNKCRDAVQEAFAKLWERRKSVQIERGKAYLLSTVHNYLVSRFRYDQLRKGVDRVGMEENASCTIEPGTDFELRDALEKALQSLPPIQRECLQLRDIEGYTYKEISNILNLSEDQVSVYLFRAKVALRKKLIEYKI